MSYEKDQGDSFFMQFKIKEALKCYLQARNRFFVDGKYESKIKTELQIAKCLVILGKKEEAIEIFNELIEETQERLMVNDYYNVVIDFAYSYLLFGEYLESIKMLKHLEEEVIESSSAEIYFKYWQTRAQILIEEHRLDEAKVIIKKLMEKSSDNTNFKPFYYELKVVEAQIYAEEGRILEAYNNINEALKYFQAQPFERAAFEKKIILSQFVEEPEETLKLIDEYLARYGTEDFLPTELEVFRIRLAIRTGKIDITKAIEKLERALLIAQSSGNKNTEADAKLLLASLYQMVNESFKSFQLYSSAREYYKKQKLEYKEAQAVFFYLPALLQRHSAAILGIGMLFAQNPNVLDNIISSTKIDKEIEWIIKVFQKYKDPVKEKMSLFFLLSYRIPFLGQGPELQESVKQIREIYKWMENHGEMYYSEMIGQFLELLDRVK